jgi:hypothetical protein
VPEASPDVKKSGPLAALSDDELLWRLCDLVGTSRRVESEIVVHIAEVDDRQLWAREATGSMFEYCTVVLHLSEAEAYLRIAVARACREHPVLLTMLIDGRLHLSGIAKLAPHLTEENRDQILPRAIHKSKKQIQELIAELEPKPDAPPLIRKLPAPRSQGEALGRQTGVMELRPDAVALPQATSSAPAAAQSPRAGFEATAPARYKVQFTASAAFRDKIQRLAALMRTTVPDGDLAAILEIAVTEKLARVAARRFGRTAAPRKRLADADTSAGSRYMPMPVRRAVDGRDGGQCAYTSASGRRCAERVQLQFHHGPTPYARGGGRSPDNIQLLCRAHNLFLAEQEFGKQVMARYRKRRRRGTG